MDFLSCNTMFGLAAIPVLFFCYTNAKSLPFAHTIRLLPSLYRVLSAVRSKSKSKKQASTPEASITKSAPVPLAAVPALFTPHTTTSNATLLDLDINLHKSNSTFFLDADISRATLLTTMLQPILGKTMFILAGVQASFRREVKLGMKYVVSTQVLGWDEAGLWVVTWFLKPGSEKEFLNAELKISGEDEKSIKELVKEEKSILAVGVAKYVFKAGRKTVKPDEALREAGLLIDSTGKESKGSGEVKPLLGEREVERLCQRGLAYVRECML